VIVLSFVVLLLMVVMAYFSKSLLDRQIAKSSAGSTLVQHFADGAVNAVIGDLRAEISDTNRSTSFTNSVAGSFTNTIYYPTAATNMVPALAGSTGANGLENLVKRSSSANPSYTGATNRAAASSSTNASANGRYISPARWNKPLLIQPTATNDFTPISSAGFVAPDWIYVARNGSNPTAWNANMCWSETNSSTVIGRYAYAIYDEGGLLDANVAGYPTAMANASASYKSATALADLTQIGLNQTHINALVGWRNYATGNASGTFPSYSFPDNGTNFSKAILSNTNGFLKTANTALNNNKSDRKFPDRQTLIEFLKNADPANLSAGLNALRYLGTFSRSLEQPSYAPDPSRPKVLDSSKGGNKALGADDDINPRFLEVRVSSVFKRNNSFKSAYGPSDITKSDFGQVAAVGEPLVKERFALNRLAWITYAGPSATRNTSATATTGSDGDIGLLKQNGITKEWLDLGTDSNIQKFFGLSWDSTNSRWKYNVHNGSTGTGSTGAITRIKSLPGLAQPREADFFELLKGTLQVGSLGKALLNSKTALAAPTGASQAEVPENYYYERHNSVDYQIIQIGANIIDQYDADGYPTRIVFDDGSSLGSAEFQGVENLPYLSTVVNGILQVAKPLPTSGDSNGNPILTSDAGNGTLTAPGLGLVMQMPVIWNPHDINSSMGTPRPMYFRAVMDSTTPDNVSDSGGPTYNKVFAYATSRNREQPGTYTATGTITTIGALADPEYSYKADAASPDSNSGAGILNYKDSTGVGSALANSIYANNSALNFEIPSGSNALFREPTMLMRGGFPSGSNLQLASTHRLLSDSAIGSRASTSGVKTAYADPLGLGTSLDPVDSAFVGFYLGSFPLRWTKTVSAGGNATQYTLSSSAGGVYTARYVAGTAGGAPSANFYTYRLQCSSSASGPWVTYDSKYGATSGSSRLLADIGSSSLINGYSNREYPGAGGGFGYYAAPADPRSNRFGLFRQDAGMGDGFGKALNARIWNSNTGDKRPSPGWVDASNRIMLTLSPDGSAGWFFTGYDAYKTIAATSGWNINTVTATTWSGSPTVMKPGLLQQNNTDAQSHQSKYYSDGQGGSGNAGYYYADPDGVVRRAVGAWVPAGTTTSPTMSTGLGKAPPATTTVGLPMSRATSFNGTTMLPAAGQYSPTINGSSTISLANYNYQAQSRPFMLNRPFRSVGELGYVFRDTPWRNLSLSTPETGDAALLDVFCLNELGNQSALAAGKIQLNTKQQPVLKAVLSGSSLDDPQTTLNTPLSTSSPTVAGAIATALVTRTQSTATGYGPFVNLSDLVGRFKQQTAIATVNSGDVNLTLANGFIDGKLSYIGFSGEWDSASRAPFVNKTTDLLSVYNTSYTSNALLNGPREAVSYIPRLHEAPIRTLASTSQTRVWNLLIDAIAQVGRYSQSASALDSFTVEGEQRVWVHVAIDRLTGAIVDQQVEIVKE
jgi:hypothetical protein